MVPGRCSVCSRAIDRPAAVLLGRGDRPTMALCDECMLVDPRTMVSIDDDADTSPLDVVRLSLWRRVVAPLVAFTLALLSRCWSLWTMP